MSGKHSMDRIKLLSGDENGNDRMPKAKKSPRFQNHDSHNRSSNDMRRDDTLDMDDPGDTDNDQDEEVVYTAGESTGTRNQVKIELEPNGYHHHSSRTSGTSRSRGGGGGGGGGGDSGAFFSNSNHSKNYELKRMQFVKSQDDQDSSETGCLRVYKFFLLNLSFFIYGAAMCLIINSKQHFIDALHTDFISITNLITIGMASILLGMFLVSFVITRYDRFYLLFFSSLATSIILITLPFLNSNLFLTLFIILFGLCFGITKTVGYKWCLKTIKRRFTNYKLNMLYIQILIGLLLSYSALMLFTTTSPKTSTSSNNLVTLASNISLVKNSPQDQLKVRVRRQAGVETSMISSPIRVTNTTTETQTATSIGSISGNDTTIATSTKFHKPKPEFADGGQLEQSHITKPINQNLVTPSPTKSMEEKIDECLANLDKVCSLGLSKFVLSSGTTSAQSLLPNQTSQTMPFSCQYGYVYRPIQNIESKGTWINANDNQAKNCQDLLDINTNSSLQLPIGRDQTCFGASRFEKKIVEPIVSSCQVNYPNYDASNSNSTSGSATSTSVVPIRLYTANSTVSCAYENTTLVEMCRLMYTTTTTTTPLTTTEITTTSTATTTITTSTTTPTTTTPPTTTTSTTTTTPTTTTTTTTPTTATTAITTTQGFNFIDFGNNLNGENTDYIDMAMDLMGVWTKKFSEFYSTMNNLQMFYTTLGIINLIVTGLYSLLALPYLAALVKSVIRLFFKLVELVCCWRLCCANKLSKKKRLDSNVGGSGGGGERLPMRFKRLRMTDDNDDDDGWAAENTEAETQMLNGGSRNSYFKYRIEEDQDDDDTDLFADERDYLSHRHFLRVSSFWFSLSLFFLYGSLLSNFLLFMNSYFISRLSSSNYNQVEIVNKLFFLSLVLGRLLTLAYISMTKSSNDSATSSSSSIATSKRFFICQLLARRAILFSITLITLLIVSIVQMSSSHFSLNLKVLLVRAAVNFQATSSTLSTATSSSLATDSTAQPLQSIGDDVHFTVYTMGIYGVLYPLLISSIVPQLISLIETNRCIVYNVRPHVALSFFWAAVLVGACTQSFVNNYLIYSFKTPNSFIYTNIFASSLLIVFLIFYSRVSSTSSNNTSNSG